MEFTSFKEFLEEKDTSYSVVLTGVNSKSFEDNKAELQQLNAAIERATNETFITPYIGLGVISKILAYANIIVPQYIFLDKKQADIVIEVTRFGLEDKNYFLHLSYELLPTGFYSVYGELVMAEDVIEDEEIN